MTSSRESLLSLRPPAPLAFTLVELMVAISVLAVLCSLVLQVMSSTSRLTGNSRQTTDCDIEARYALDQISMDLARRIRRPDASAYIDKLSGDDRFYFFAEAPGYDPDLPVEQRSNISLVGYRIRQRGTEFALQRFAKALPWSSSNGKIAMPYVMADYSLNADKSNPAFIMDQSTLAGAFPSVISQSSSEENSYQTIAENVVRFEVSLITSPTSFDENTGTLLSTPLPSGTAPRFPSSQRVQERIRTELNGHGLSRISAIVITLAIVDPQNIMRLSEAQIKTFVTSDTFDAIHDENSILLPMEAWNRELITQSSSLPKPLKNGIRFYQRVINL